MPDALTEDRRDFRSGTRAATRRAMRTSFAILACGLVACSSPIDRTSSNNGSCPAASSAVTAALERVDNFGANPGALAMHVHAPPGPASAVVVVMHGCTQSAADYTKAGWNELADRVGFVVVYPEQSATNDPMRCFHWYLPEDTTRGKGEAASIAAMAEWAKKKYGATRAFVTGLSAGGAMTSVMLATYPDVFEAGAIIAGIPYGCAKSQLEAFRCMSATKELDAQGWAALVPRGNGPAPRVSIWQGDADYTVRPKNEATLVAQWATLHGVSGDPTVEDVGKAKHAVYKDAAGVAQVESWVIGGMGHGTPLAPGEGCGTAAAYMLDVGICSTTHAAAFFGLVDPSNPGAPAAPGAGPGTPGGSSAAAPAPCD